MAGLRVGNLLVLTVKNVQCLFNEETIQIALNKRGAVRHHIELSQGKVNFIKIFKKQ